MQNETENTLFSPRGVDARTESQILARLYGEPLSDCPDGLYIPPEALRVFLESFEGPLDLLLYLIRRQKFDIMDIPMADLTDQYMRYVDLVRESDLELAATYLVMSATLMQIKSRLLLPVHKEHSDEEVEDPRAELMRRLAEYEKMRAAALKLNDMPRLGRDFRAACAGCALTDEPLLPEVDPADLTQAWLAVTARLKLTARHKITRQELSVREHMSEVLRRLNSTGRLSLADLCGPETDRERLAVWFLSLLELAKEGLIILTQGEPYTGIYASLAEEGDLLTVRCPAPQELF